MVVPSRNAIPSLTPLRCCARCSRRSQTPWRLQRLKVCAAIHQGPRCGGMLRHFAPLSCRQMITSMVRRRFLCSVLCGGGHCAISGGSAAHFASVKRHNQFHLSWHKYGERPQGLTDPMRRLDKTKIFILLVIYILWVVGFIFFAPSVHAAPPITPIISGGTGTSTPPGNNKLYIG